jgi:hypothetical protein
MPYQDGIDRRHRRQRPGPIAVAVARTAPRRGELPRAVALVLALGCAVEFALALAASLAR